MWNVGIEGRVNGASFSTKDRDHSKMNCPVSYHGGWWYINCEYSDLNGRDMNWNFNLHRTISKSMMMITKY